MALHQIGFEQQRFRLAAAGDDIDAHDLFDHAHDAGAEVVRLGVVADAVFKVFRLADIEDLIRRIQHTVDTGSGRHGGKRCANRLRADERISCGCSGHNVIIAWFAALVIVPYANMLKSFRIIF